MSYQQQQPQQYPPQGHRQSPQAFAPAKPPFFRRGWFLGLIGLVAGVIVGTAAHGSGGAVAAPSATVTITQQAAPAAATGKAPVAGTAAAAPAASKPADAAPTALSDNGWTVVGQVQMKWGSSLPLVTIRVRNDGADTHSGSFTITYLATDGSAEATFSGVANDVAAGKVATVTMVTADRPTKKPTGSIAFQALTI